MQLLKAQNSFEKDSSVEKEREKRSVSRGKEEEKPTKREETPKAQREDPPKVKKEEPPKSTSSIKDDVNFLMQVFVVHTILNEK